jgi:hypothetical protein
VAELVMFDGHPATVRLEQWSLAGILSWSSQWITLPGGACSFEDGEWVRLDANLMPVLPLFGYDTQTI